MDYTCFSSFNECFCESSKPHSPSVMLLSAIVCVLCATWTKALCSRNPSAYLFLIWTRLWPSYLFILFKPGYFLSLRLPCHSSLPTSFHTTYYLDLSPWYFGWGLLRHVFWYVVKAAFPSKICVLLAIIICYETPYP